jgi:hypothetical protein
MGLKKVKGCVTAKLSWTRQRLTSQLCNVSDTNGAVSNELSPAVYFALHCDQLRSCSIYRYNFPSCNLLISIYVIHMKGGLLKFHELEVRGASSSFGGPVAYGHLALCAWRKDGLTIGF